MTISAELAGALRYCGDIRGERIELPDLWEFYLDSCATMDADLQISESWRQLSVRDIGISEREQSLASIENFAFEVGLDYRVSGSDDRWITLPIVAPERVSDEEELNHFVASFYGHPRNVILSFDPTNYEFRLWSVSSQPAERANANEVSGLPETFAPLRKLLTAHKALPHCGHDEATFDRLEKVILRELEIWEPRWERFKNKPRKREGSRRPGFKSVQRRNMSRNRMRF
jgi:hypothetical protein